MPVAYWWEKNKLSTSFLVHVYKSKDLITTSAFSMRCLPRMPLTLLMRPCPKQDGLDISKKRISGQNPCTLLSSPTCLLTLALVRSTFELDHEYVQDIKD